MLLLGNTAVSCQAKNLVSYFFWIPSGLKSLVRDLHEACAAVGMMIGKVILI